MQLEIPERIAASGVPTEERELKLTGPQTLADCVGQEDIKENLSIFIEAAK